MSSVTFDKLYENYNVLSEAKDKVSEHSKEYLEAIEGTKGDEREKKLATQIISKFFKNFPSLQLQAMEAIFDVCEDDEASIRIAAMKSLPIFCKDTKEYVSKIADILAQLLQLEDAQEYNTASNSLLQILKANPVTVIKCIFKQILTGDNVVRDKCIKFLITKVKSLDKSVLSPEVDDVIITECKKVFQDVTAEEFINLMPFLISTRICNTFTGQQELVDIAGDQAEIEAQFDPLDKESNNVDRLITCIKLVLPFFSPKVESTKFVTYICDQVLPQWDKIASLENGDLFQLAILRQLAELSTHCGKLDAAALYVVHIFEKLQEYMPPPPEDTSIITMPLLDFTVVECLLYAFHKLARQCPDFLVHDPQALKDFRARLVYFSRGAQGCSKALSNLDIKDKSLTDEDIKKKKIAPKILSNINVLIKDLFYQPPKYQCIVPLSFKSEEAALKKVQEKEPSGPKRHVPITFEANGANAAATTSSKHPRSGRSSDGVKLYTPPSGKFSNNFQSYGGRARGRNLRGGTGRGRNPGRSWRN